MQEKRKIDLFTDSHRGAWGPLSRVSDTWVDITGFRSFETRDVGNAVEG
jgi:hypothetical protein